MKQRQWQQFKANSNCQGTVYRAIYEEDRFLMLIGLYSKTSIHKNFSSKSRRMGGKQWEVDWHQTQRVEKTAFLSGLAAQSGHCFLKPWDAAETDSCLCPYFSHLYNISCKIITRNIKLSFYQQHQIPLHRALPNSCSDIAVSNKGDDAFFLVHAGELCP